MSGKKIKEPLTIRYLNKQFNLLSELSRDERVTELGLNFDRADVIVHALRIYRHAMNWCGAHYMYAPKIGVSDGIIRDLYHREYRESIEGS